MNLARVPPSVVIALGLHACGPEVTETPEGTTTGLVDSTSTGPVSAPGTSTGRPTAATTGGSTTEVATTALSACLSFVFDPDMGPGSSETGSGSGSGTGSGSGSGTSSGSDSGTSSGSDSGTGSGSTTGAREEADRATVVDRLIDRGALPADVSRRLREGRGPGDR